MWSSSLNPLFLVRRDPFLPGWRIIRKCLSGAVLVVLASFSLVKLVPATAAPDASAIDIKATAVPLNAADWSADIAGQLRYRGGVHLTSPNKRFGGLSGLLVSADGKEFTAVSDGGTWTRGALTYDADGNLSGVADVTIEPLRDVDGKPLTGARGDAESLAFARNDELVVAFERDPKLLVYPNDRKRPTMLDPPDGIDRAPGNHGMEAVTRLADGRLLVVAEHDEEPGKFPGWIGNDGSWSRVTYLCDQGYKPTGATTLANGDVVFVERRFPLLSIRVRRVPAAALIPGAEIEAEELARLEGSRSFDNMEGIATREGPNGETLIYLLSDDNFRSFQRTLLMMFELQQ